MNKWHWTIKTNIGHWKTDIGQFKRATFPVMTLDEGAETESVLVHIFLAVIGGKYKIYTLNKPLR